MQKKNEKALDPTDIFDVKRPSTSRRATVMKVPIDVEAPESLERIRSIKSEEIDASLIPRATIIATNYQKFPDVAAKQSRLDRRMQRRTARGLAPTDSDTDESDDTGRTTSRRASVVSKTRLSRNHKLD